MLSQIFEFLEEQYNYINYSVSKPCQNISVSAYYHDLAKFIYNDRFFCKKKKKAFLCYLNIQNLQRELRPFVFWGTSNGKGLGINLWGGGMLVCICPLSLVSKKTQSEAMYYMVSDFKTKFYTLDSAAFRNVSPASR